MLKTNLVKSYIIAIFSLIVLGSCSKSEQKEVVIPTCNYDAEKLKIETTPEEYAELYKICMASNTSKFESLARQWADKGYASGVYYLGKFYDRKQEGAGDAYYLTASKAGYYEACKIMSFAEKDSIKRKEYDDKWKEACDREVKAGNLQAYVVKSYYEPWKDKPFTENNLLLQAAEQGYAEAQYFAYQNYFHGYFGFPVDTAKAMNWLIEASKQGNPNAQAILAKYYENGGCGISIDSVKAYDLYMKSAEQGFGLSLYMMGVYHRDGIIVPQNREKAVEYFSKACDGGFDMALYALGVAYYKGEGVKKDEDKSQEYFEKYAALSSDNAYLVATMYSRGEYVDEDKEKAAKWYTQAANREHVNGNKCYELGRLYARGREDGVLKDEKQAFYWYSRAAKLGHIYARIELGRCYENGVGVEKNERMAQAVYDDLLDEGYTNEFAQYIQKGKFIKGKAKDTIAFTLFLHAREEDVDAKFNLADCYRYGIGTERNDSLYKDCIEKLANLGYIRAKILAGNAHELENPEEAIKYYEDVANNNQAVGKYHLGRCYYYGIGIEKDEEVGLQLLHEAATDTWFLGDFDAQMVLAQHYNSVGGWFKTRYWKSKAHSNYGIFKFWNNENPSLCDYLKVGLDYLIALDHTPPFWLYILLQLGILALFLYFDYPGRYVGFVIVFIYELVTTWYGTYM